MEYRYLAVFLIPVLLASTAFATATGDLNSAKNRELISALAHANCRQVFLANVLSSFSNLSNVTMDISLIAATLKNDTTTLQGFVTNSNQAGFRDYVKNNFDPDIRAATQAVNTVRKALQRGDRLMLKAVYQRYRNQYDGCSLDAIRMRSLARVTRYNAEIGMYQEKVADLVAKGFDASSMIAIFNDAQAQVITPLQNAIDAAANETGLRAAIGAYCLFDGCPGDVNFHLEAKIEISKLNIIFNYLDSKITSEDVKAKIVTGQGYVNDATTALTSVGTAQYTKAQEARIWGDIRSGYQTIKDIRDMKKPLSK